MIKSEVKLWSNTKKIVIFSSVWFFVLSNFAAGPSATLAQDNPQLTGKLLIGIADFPPYVMNTKDGKWEGISLELWQAVAKELEINYEIKEFSRMSQVVEAFQKQKLDLAPRMVLTEYAETVMDLSHSYHRSHLAIAVLQDRTGHNWIGFFKRFASRDTLKLIILLLLLAMIAGAIIWLLENKKKP